MHARKVRVEPDLEIVVSPGAVVVLHLGVIIGTLIIRNRIICAEFDCPVVVGYCPAVVLLVLIRFFTAETPGFIPRRSRVLSLLLHVLSKHADRRAAA